MQTTEAVAYPKYQTLLGFRMHQIVTDHAGNWCKNWKFTCVIGNLVTLERFRVARLGQINGDFGIFMKFFVNIIISIW